MKRVKKLLSFVLILFFGIESAYCSTAVFSSRRTRPFELEILTGASGGQWDCLGGSIAEVLSQNDMFTISRLGGAIANINKINQGDSDLGFSMTCFLGMSDLKKGAFGHIGTENVELLANMYPQIFYVLVRKDIAEKYHLDNMEDLLTKNLPIRFATLKPGSGSEFFLKVLLKYGYNVSYSQLRKKGWQISFNNYSEIADNFVNGDLDCFAYTAGAGVPLIISMEQHIDLKLLSISKPVRDVLQKKFGIESYTILSGTYKSATRPIQTIGDYACLVVRKSLPEEVVYAISNTLWRERKSLGANVKDFHLFAPDSDLKKGFNIHPGAKKFWNENRNE